MKWFTRPGYFIAILLFVVAAVLGVIGIIYGVSTHEEGGLLRVCWNESNSAEYVVPFEGAPVGDCADPEDLVWPKNQVPLGVSILDLREDGDGVEGKAAIVDINNQLGFTLFTQVKEGSSVSLTLGAPVEGGSKKLGTAHHYKSPEAMYAHATVYSATGSLRLTFLVAHHELLHVAGLAHDSFPDSAMYGMDHDDSLERMTPARITDHDKSLLRDLYSPTVQ